MAALLHPSPHNHHHASLAAHGDQRLHGSDAQYREEGDVSLSDASFYNLLSYPVGPLAANRRPPLTSRLLMPALGCEHEQQQLELHSDNHANNTARNSPMHECCDEMLPMLPVSLQQQSSSELPWLSPALTVSTSFPSFTHAAATSATVGSSMHAFPLATPSSDTSSYFAGSASGSSAFSLPMWSPPAALNRSASFASSLLIENESDAVAASASASAAPSPAAAPASAPSAPAVPVLLPNPWAANSDALPSPYPKGGVMKRELSSNRDAFDAIAPDFDASHDPLPEIYSDMELPYAFVAPVVPMPPAPVASAPIVTPQLNFEYAQSASTTVLGALPASPPLAATPSPPAATDAADNDFALGSSTPMSPESEIDTDLVPPVASSAVAPAAAPVARVASRASAAPAAPAAPAPLKFAASLPRGAKSKALRERERERKHEKELARSEAKDESREQQPSQHTGLVRAVPPAGSGPLAAVRGPLASVGVYTRAERRAKIERYKAKRRARLPAGAPLHPRSGGQYACRKSFADRRPRIAGRFVKMDDETKKYLSLTKPGAAQPAPPDLVPPPAIVAWTQASHHATDHTFAPAPAPAGTAAPPSFGSFISYPGVAASSSSSSAAYYPPTSAVWPSSHAYAPYVQPSTSSSSGGMSGYSPSVYYSSPAPATPQQHIAA